MASWFIFMVWMGGIPAAYARHRSLGQGRLTASFDAAIWPGGIGRQIALKFYREW